jgi:hypothetical protein
MMKLIALLALAGAAAAGIVYALRDRKSMKSTWTSTRDMASEWATTVSDQAGKAADSASDAADTASHGVGELKDALEDKTKTAS